MNERRTRTRRTRHLIPEGLSRKRDRRGEERRDSPRGELMLEVREAGREKRQWAGDVSLAGASFVTSTPPASDSVELTFSIPTFTGPIVASAVVVARVAEGKSTRVRVVFTELELEAELAIAQWLDRSLPGATDQTAELR